MRKRLAGKLREINVEVRRRRHHPLPEVARWLRSVLAGHYRYFGVPGNWNALATFRHQAGRLWYKALRRRSQRTRLNWTRMKRLVNRWLPNPRIHHPYPERRFIVRTRGRSPVR